MRQPDRCPLDGAPLREWTEPVNAAPTYVHADGTTHGGMLELVEKWEASMARLGEQIHALMPAFEAQARSGLAVAGAIEWPTFPPLGPLTED